MDNELLEGTAAGALSLTGRLKHEAARLGFVACGIAEAAPLPDVRRVFEDRIEQGFYSGLPWFTAARAERSTSPDMVLAGARSIVSVAAPYARGGFPQAETGEPRGKIARYAWGRDYHRILEKRLRALSAFIDAEAPASSSRTLVDYGPLAERAYAARAGIGWQGKSTNLLLPGEGSWVFLAEIITTAHLLPDPPLRKTCGQCRRCVNACPTGAIVDGYVVDNQRCIAFQTIENRGPIPRELRPLIGTWLFGCDICQEVCPVGAAAATQPMAEFASSDAEDAAPALIPLLALDEEAFRQRFAGRAVMRAKRDGLLRNACVVLGNLADRGAVPALAKALGDPSSLVRGHAAWALGRLGGESARHALSEALANEHDPWVRDEIVQALDEVSASG